jgi:hypothetical protein
MLPVDDPVLGYGFLGDCNSGLRTADNDCQYSATNCSTCGSEIHDCGQLLSGCIWDVRNELYITEPVDYLEIISNLTVNSILLHTGTGIDAQIPIDLLTLDDDDANLDNGTPHWDEICTGFSLHGIDCPELTPIWFSYPDDKPEMVPPLQETTVRVVVNSGSLSPVSGSGELYYSIDGAPFQTGTMTETAPNEYDAILPATPCDSKIDWYVSAEASGFGTVTDPSDAPASYFSAIVATGITTVFIDSFETNQGWTVSGSVSDGQWQRGTPAGGGDRGDPPTDYDGSGQCYVTDNADGNSDVDGGTTILTSPSFDLSAGDGRINYARWYSNHTGDDPNNDVFEVYISNNDGLSWTLAETVGPVDQANGGWYEHSFYAGEFVAPSAFMKVKFEASDLGSGSIVEAGVDMFSVVIYECQGSPQVTITTDTLPEWTESHPGYSATLEAANGTEPYVWSDLHGDLTCTGLTLASDGTISGMPTSAGTISFTAYVEDDLETSDQEQFDIQINAAPQVMTTSLPDWTEGQFYNQTLTATGGTGGLTWSDADGGLSGTGLTLVAGTGQLHGTPSAGTISFTARVTDILGAYADQPLAFTINPPVEITTTSPLPAWVEDQPGYTATLESTGGTSPFSWTNPGNDLNGTGLSLSSDGVVSGTPTASDTITFTARVTDHAAATDTRSLEIPIYATLTILTMSPLPEWTVNQPGYSQTLNAIGGDGAYTWSDLNGDLIGSGLTLANDGSLTGTPTSVGTIAFTAQVEDGYGQVAQRNLSLTINEWPAFDGDTLLAEWTVNHPGYAVDLVVSGGTGVLTFTPVATNGISLDAAGHVSGTPTSEGAITFTAEVADETGADAQQFHVVPVNPRPMVDTDLLPEWTQFHPGYTAQLTASGGTGALTFTAQSFAGLNLDATGMITGTPNSSGILNFTVEVIDAVGANVQKELNLLVNDPVAITTAATLPSWVEDEPGYSVQLEATGGTAGLTWFDDGGLSGSGLVLASDGLLTGTPTEAGSLEFTATATDQIGADDIRTFTIEIDPAYICGDLDGNEVVNVSDITAMIQYVFGDDPAPDPIEAADVDCNGSVNVSDVVYLIEFVFGEGPEPCAGCAAAAGRTAPEQGSY